MEAWPKIRSKQTARVSPWLEIITREVEFTPGSAPEVYHAIGQFDYVSIVPLTPDGRVPIVRQYRPALEGYTWEFPAGLVDDGEDAAETCRRELKEEAGFTARSVHLLGTGSPCTGRLSNRIHSFFAETVEHTPAIEPEAGMSVKVVSLEELAQMIKAGEFVSQLHLGALLLATLHGFVKLPR